MTPAQLLLFWIACGVLGLMDFWACLARGKSSDTEIARTVFAILRQDDPAYFAALFALVAMAGGGAFLAVRIAMHVDRWTGGDR